MGEAFGMERLSEVFVERKVEENAHKFIIYFLYDDENQNVLVDEVEEIDFLKVIQHLDFGGSVFITHRRKVTHTEEQIYEVSCVGGEIEDSPFLHRHSKSLDPIDLCGG
ncbi:MAG: hypothetical protein OEZ24_00380 [Candidatus Bathyarchaeota archaeon]|nr:hypothetical protein [Candidatus Bathyarchaeota archaeon]